ncbi:MAG: TRAM domain-containing protein [Candidatus Aenigmarchaeota archaeon]|nr:TRAM domain-containing protein [Candidatus Aenigmarchaeota archaeon]
MRFERRGFGGRRFGGGGGRSDFGDSTEPKPVKVGEEYDVEVSEVGSKGDGIARVKNFVVFINGAKQGEKTHIKITSVSNRFAIGEKTSGASSEEAGETEEATGEATEEAPEENTKVSEEEGEEEE